MADANEKNIEQLKGALEFAKQAISYTFLLNGGALVGMLAFMGNAIDKLPNEKLDGLAGSSGFFIAGLVIATVCSIVAYIAQLNYFKIDIGISDDVSDPTTLRVVLIILLIASVAAFSLGAINAFDAMTGLQT